MLRAKELSLPSVTLFFEPQPGEYLSSRATPARLMSLSEKLYILQSLKVDLALCLRFTEQLASLSAMQFIHLVLENKLNVKHLVVGDDFVFGHKQGGDLSSFHKSQENFGFVTEMIPSVNLDQTKVSSTFIRQLLKSGDLMGAKKFLGRAYSMTGRVAHGTKRGRILGFPTANICLRHKVLPMRGVYARPTFGGDLPLLEVHLLDFYDDIYGVKIKVEFLRKIRSEQKFTDFEKLREKIEQDVKIARAFLSCEVGVPLDRKQEKI